jgi:hypothetical protein
MSKLVVLMIALIALSGVISAIAIKPAGCADVITQNFDDESTGVVPQGWTVVDPSICSLEVSDTAYFGISGKSAKFTDETHVDASQAHVKRDFAKQYGSLVFSFAVMVEVPDYFDVYIHDGFARGANVYFMPDGMIAYYENYEWHNLRPFSVGTWYEIRMVIDVPANAYDIYVDGSLEASEVRFRGFGSVAYLDRIELGGQSYETPVGYIDNLSLSAQEHKPSAVTVKMTGGLDYLFQEDIKIRLGAIVKDADTMTTVSNATVTIEIYYPNGSLWISDTMTEKLAGTGIYEWESSGTIQQMNLEKGIYLVKAQASKDDSASSIDTLLFHIDPPAGTPPPTLGPYNVVFMISMIAAIVTGTFILMNHRKRPLKRGLIRSLLL